MDTVFHPSVSRLHLGVLAVRLNAPVVLQSMTIFSCKCTIPVSPPIPVLPQDPYSCCILSCDSPIDHSISDTFDPRPAGTLATAMSHSVCGHIYITLALPLKAVSTKPPQSQGRSTCIYQGVSARSFHRLMPIPSAHF